jgi:hypothetical protein
MHSWLPVNINVMFIQQLTEEICPPIQNTVGICKQITILVLSQVSSRLVILLKFTYAPLLVFHIFVVTPCFKLIDFVFQVFSFIICNQSMAEVVMINVLMVYC